MKRYQAEVKLTVFFDTDTPDEDMTEEEVEVRAADAIAAGHVLESETEDWFLEGPTPTVAA